MINKLVATILKFFLWLCNLVVGVITLPLARLVNLLIPDLSSYTTSLNQFLNDYIFNGIRFAKEVFLNITHFPRPLFGIAVAFASALFAYFISTIAIRALINIWAFIKGGKTD